MGCLCAVEFNRSGQGAYHTCDCCGVRGKMYWVAPDCKVHRA